MACEAIHMWSLSGLVAAFLDLAIAYLLLCASAVAYLASRFLGFFGINLPCPCDGMFINIHSKTLCFGRMLIDNPTQKVSNVQLCVKQNFPFSYSKCPKEYGYGISGNNCVNGFLEMEGEASCSSVLDTRRSEDMVRREVGSRKGKYDLKGKGVLSHRPRSRLRNGRRGGGDHGKNSLLLCLDPPVSDDAMDGELYSKFSSNKRGSGFIGGASYLVDNAGIHIPEYDSKTPKKKRGRHRATTNVEMSESHDEDMHVNRSIQAIEEIQDNQQGFQSVGGDDKNTIRFLEQKLSEERIARATLYIELEKERSAAATAADEAMAMILRLQEEKASIEIEARQYQRILEEKSLYDAEEMNILKEILVRREMEKHFLVKEVEAYRQTASLGNAQLVVDDSGETCAEKRFGHLPDSKDDPVLILRQPTASPIQCPVEHISFDKNRDFTKNSVKEPICDLSEDLGLQEKEVIIANKNKEMVFKPPLYQEELEQVMEMNHAYKIDEKIIETCDGVLTSDSNYGRNLMKLEKDAFLELSSSSYPMLDKEPHVYDLHIIGDGSSSKHHDRNSVPSTSCLGTEDDVIKSSSQKNCGLPPVGRRGLSLVSDIRRSSTSAMDVEMLKIDSECGWLQERLKLVQEGREKVGLSLENRERENVQLKLLEDIARQVQEIRHLTEPGKAARQVSLPPPTSKVLSKKRRSRSVSSGLQISSEAYCGGTTEQDAMGISLNR